MARYGYKRKPTRSRAPVRRKKKASPVKRRNQSAKKIEIVEKVAENVVSKPGFARRGLGLLKKVGKAALIGALVATTYKVGQGTYRFGSKVKDYYKAFKNNPPPEDPVWGHVHRRYRRDLWKEYNKKHPIREFGWEDLKGTKRSGKNPDLGSPTKKIKGWEDQDVFGDYEM